MSVSSCLRYLFTNAYVGELSGCHTRIRSFIAADYNQNYRCALSLNINRSLRRRNTKFQCQNISLTAHLFIIKI